MELVDLFLPEGGALIVRGDEFLEGAFVFDFGLAELVLQEVVLVLEGLELLVEAADLLILLRLLFPRLFHFQTHLLDFLDGRRFRRFELFDDGLSARLFRLDGLRLHDHLDHASLRLLSICLIFRVGEVEPRDGFFGELGCLAADVVVGFSQLCGQSLDLEGALGGELVGAALVLGHQSVGDLDLAVRPQPGHGLLNY